MQKQILTQLIAIFLCIGAYAQSPNKFPFQGVAKNSNGNALTNTTINTLKVTLKTGETEYVETYNNVETDANGMFFLNVGEGEVVSGDFNDLDWGKHAAVINLEVDGQTTPDTQLLSVPYAIHANSSNVATTNSVLDISDFGIVADNGQADKTLAIKEVIDNLINSGDAQYIKNMNGSKSIEILINKGVRYSYFHPPNQDIPRPNTSDLYTYLSSKGFTDYTIHDNSSWDNVTNAFGGQIRKIIHTENPTEKNANMFNVASTYHPALVLDNLETAGSSYQASVMFRTIHGPVWTVGMGYKFRPDFALAAYQGAGTAILLADRDGRFGFNADFHNAKTLDPINSPTYMFKGRDGIDDNRIQLIAEKEGLVNLDFSFYPGQGSIYETKSSLTADYAGNLNLTNSGDLNFINSNNVNFTNSGNVNFLNDVKADFYMNYDLYGYKDKVINKTEYDNHYLSEGESQKVFTNEESEGNFAFKLPTATVGLKYRFVVVTSNLLGVIPTGTDIIRCIDNGQAILSDKVGSSIELFCVTNGIWEIGYDYGTWTSYKTLNGETYSAQHPINVIFEDCSN